MRRDQETVSDDLCDDDSNYMKAKDADDAEVDNEIMRRQCFNRHGGL